LDEIKILIPQGCLGYHYNQELFVQALKHKPDAIAVDAGSVDPGPYYLGMGKSFVSRDATKTDLIPLLSAAMELDIPFIATTAGGAGGNKHLIWMADIVREIAEEKGFSFPMALISAEVDKEYLKRRAKKEIIPGLGHDGVLTPEIIERTSVVVAQMGYEPIVEALSQGAQVVLAGRACDDVGIAAYPIYKGFPTDYALPMGKVTECGASCLEGRTRRSKGGSVPLFGIVRRDGFMIMPSPEATEALATVRSIADHMMYEERDPLRVIIPGGVEDSSDSTFEQFDERAVLVRGSRFIRDPVYKVKLEGSAFVGYRCVIVGGTRSREMIEQIDNILEETREVIRIHYKHVPAEEYQVHFHVYGRNGVMGSLEPNKDALPHELGIVTEVVASDQDLADSICHYAAGTYLHHMWYPGSRSDCCGNIAFAFSPLEIGKEPAFEWSIHHLLTAEDPLELFPIEMEQVENSRK
jgi:hypothetical protein